jgi:N-methylhydantoinase B
MASRHHDVIAAEVHRKALENLTNEMGIALRRTSGSPIVTEVFDFSTCLLDRVPEHLGFAAYVLFHAGTSLVATQRIAELHGDDVKPGDGWIVNDPHTGGAAHQGDVAIVMPAFYRDELLGWTFSNMHVLDTGGSGVSAYAPGAHEVYEEGLLFPPVKVIRDGALDPEWERYIAANVRMPGPVLNDIRSMVSANNVGARKLGEIVDEFGLERHIEFCDINKDLSEQVLRQRIESIPDGVYSTTDWNEFDGHGGPEHLLELTLDLTVDGSDLRFDYRGVPQIDAFVNSAYGAMLGQTLTALMTTMVYADLPVNGGLWRPIHVDVGPPGTIVNSVPPAAVSNAHSEVGMRACKMTKDVLSQALALSEDPVLRGRLGAQGQDGWSGFSLTGLNQRGQRTVVFMNNISVGIGGGAQTIGDGQDSYGCTCMTGCGLADVETHEASDPILYLWRRLIPNSGGPGQFRGGQGIEEAIAVRGTESLAGPAFNAVAQVPPRGFGGGYPAASCRMHPVRNTNLGELFAAGVYPTRKRLTGDDERMRNKMARIEAFEHDVLMFGGGGGGGVGDPLLRDPESVRADVDAGFVTGDHAETVYGVALAGDGTVDADATARLRAAVRVDRIGSTPTASGAPASPGVAVERRALDGVVSWVCAACSSDLGEASGNWRSLAVSRETPIAETFERRSMYVRERADGEKVVLREYFCPSCATVLAADVSIDGAEVLAAPRVGTEAQALAEPASR